MRVKDKSILKITCKLLINGKNSDYRKIFHFTRSIFLFTFDIPRLRMYWMKLAKMQWVRLLVWKNILRTWNQSLLHERVPFYTDQCSGQLVLVENTKYFFIRSFYLNFLSLFYIYVTVQLPINKFFNIHTLYQCKTLKFCVSLKNNGNTMLKCSICFILM